MKSFILTLVLVLFAANSIVSAAWAKPCMMNMAMVEQSMADMDCHEKTEQKQNPQQHCDGICLCLHVSVTQTPMLPDQTLLSVLAPYKSTAWSFSNEHIRGFATAPPLRPPKTLS